jgi:hypothetical protein
MPGRWVVEQDGDDRGSCRWYRGGCEPDPACGWIVSQPAGADDGPGQRQPLSYRKRELPALIMRDR